MDALLQRICASADVRPPLETPPHVEVAQRTSGDRSYLFVLNHAAEPVTIALPSTMRDLLSPHERADHLRLGPHGVALLS